MKDGEYIVAEVEGEFVVLFVADDEPDWWQRIATFRTKDRADSYAEFENEFHDNELGVEDTNRSPPGLILPPSAVAKIAEILRGEARPLIEAARPEIVVQIPGEIGGSSEPSTPFSTPPSTPPSTPSSTAPTVASLPPPPKAAPAPAALVQPKVVSGKPAADQPSATPLVTARQRIIDDLKAAGRKGIPVADLKRKFGAGTASGYLTILKQAGEAVGNGLGRWWAAGMCATEAEERAEIDRHIVEKGVTRIVPDYPKDVPIPPPTVASSRTVCATEGCHKTPQPGEDICADCNTERLLKKIRRNADHVSVT